MNSSKIEEMKRKRSLEYKNKKDQKKYAFIVAIVGILICFLLIKQNYTSGITWIIGLLIGFTLQRSKFCFTASFRDPVLVGSTSVFKAVIIALMIMTVGFAIIQYPFLSDYYRIEQVPGQIGPAGMNTILGALLFGIGMVIAGGCASGTIMRIGEGFQIQLVVLLGFLIGTVIAAGSFEFWDELLIQKANPVYLPDIVGLPLSIVIQLLILGGLYVYVDRFDKKNSIMVD